MTLISNQIIRNNLVWGGLRSINHEAGAKFSFHSSENAFSSSCCASLVDVDITTSPKTLSWEKCHLEYLNPLEIFR